MLARNCSSLYSAHLLLSNQAVQTITLCSIAHKQDMIWEGKGRKAGGLSVGIWKEALESRHESEDKAARLQVWLALMRGCGSGCRSGRGIVKRENSDTKSFLWNLSSPCGRNRNYNKTLRDFNEWLMIMKLKLLPSICGQDVMCVKIYSKKEETSGHRPQPCQKCVQTGSHWRSNQNPQLQWGSRADSESHHCPSSRPNDRQTETHTHSHFCPIYYCFS